MSRTDAHRPYDVWLADQPELVVECRDHATGEARQHLSCLVRLCTCNLCRGHLWRIRARRALRTTERAFTNAAARGADEAELERLEGRLRAIIVA